MNKLTRIALAGLAAIAFTGAASASTNLVANGDFQLSARKLTDWSTKGFVGAAHFGANDYASFAGIGALSQKIGTVAGDEYALSFDLLSISAGEIFNVSYDNKSIFTTAGLGITGGHYDVDFAGVDNGKLTFSFLGLGVAALDNVSVTAVPTIPAVPEPAPVGLLAAGAGALALVARRRTAQR